MVAPVVSASGVRLWNLVAAPMAAMEAKAAASFLKDHAAQYVADFRYKREYKGVAGMHGSAPTKPDAMGRR